MATGRPVDSGRPHRAAGDLPLAKVLRALNEVGYDGVIDYDHPIGVAGDGPLPKQYIAFAVGYMRGLIQSLGG